MVDRATQSHRLSDLSVQVARLLLRDVSPKIQLKIGHLVTTQGFTTVEKVPRAVAETAFDREQMREREVSDALRLEEEHHAAVVGNMHRLRALSLSRGQSKASEERRQREARSRRSAVAFEHAGDDGIARLTSALTPISPREQAFHDNGMADQPPAMLTARAVSIIAVLLLLVANALELLPVASPFEPYLSCRALVLGLVALVAILAGRGPERDPGLPPK